MKLVIAIVNRDDVGAVTRNLTDNGFSSTWLTTSGGFLSARNATLLAGVEDEQVETVIELVKSCSHSRTRVTSSAGFSMRKDLSSDIPVEVKVGGATIFVVDVEQFLKV